MASAVFEGAAGPAMLLGVMILCGLAGAHAARLVHVPRVVGLILSGVILRALLTHGFGDHSSGSVPEPLVAVRDLALGMILFTIGGVFERGRLRAAGARVKRIATLEVGCTFVFVGLGCGLIGLTMGGERTLAEGIALALLLGAAAVATAPAATLSVLQEYDAKGPITETILGLTGVNNVICIVLFHALFLTLSAMGMVQAAGDGGSELAWELAATTVGSFVLGIAVGLGFSAVYARLSLAETLTVFFGLFVLLSAVEKWLLQYGPGVSYNFLLTALVSGGVFANLAIDSQKIDQSLRTIGAPIFVAFFVMAGYDLHLGDLWQMGRLGVAYVVLRILGKGLGCFWGVRWARAPQRTKGRLGEAMLCQAAVVIGLVSFVSRNWNSPRADEFALVILGSVVLFELIGPLLLKRRVVEAGEVKLMTLLSRARPEAERVSFLRLALQPFLHASGTLRKGGPTNAARMSVKHIMRTNVDLIPASASLDDVLHFVERSTHSHFPVVDYLGELRGVIHFSDVRDVIYDPTMRELVTAVDLADPDSTAVSPDLPLVDLLEIFSHTNVGVLPVAESPGSKRIVGLVEQRDPLRALHLSERTK